MKRSRLHRPENLVFLLPFLSGCATIGAISAVGQVANVAMQVAGMKQPANTEAAQGQKPPHRVAIRLHAGENLNAGGSNQALAVVVRLYKLKQRDGFSQASYETFLISQKEKEAFGTDVLELREITLLPGQRYEVVENVMNDANYIGLVALFRSPDPARWKAVFTATDAEKTGITIGVHACALTVGAGRLVAESNDIHKPLALARCL